MVKGLTKWIRDIWSRIVARRLRIIALHTVVQEAAVVQCDGRKITLTKHGYHEESQDGRYEITVDLH
jgi:hypothetical protein